MSEYWKSQPRKFCEACKCWFADNKASIEFHERGKRHQDNVKKRLERLCKKGLKDHQAKQKYDRQMQKIERDALKAFQKDLKEDPNLDCQFNIVAAIAVASTVPKPTRVNNIRGKQGRTDPAGISQVKAIKAEAINADIDETPKYHKWFEASAEGTSYYWNPDTGETQWEAPPEYISLTEQETLPKSAEEASVFGPQGKSTPYGQWTTVEIKVEKPIDFQLPKMEESEIASITIVPEEKPKFKERIISDVMRPVKLEGEIVTFKKRNISETKKRNVRQRLDND